MKRYFSEKAVLQMRAAIADADGNEVFFLGRTDEAKLVIEAEPLARGNRDAVPAILVAASFGDVVVHNHPSGLLTPSPADLSRLTRDRWTPGLMGRLRVLSLATGVGRPRTWG